MYFYINTLKYKHTKSIYINMSYNMERGFKVVTFNEFRNMHVSTLNPRPLVVFVNRRKAFNPPLDLLKRTDEWKRKAKNDKSLDPYRKRTRGYEGEYRSMIVRSSRALGELREIAMMSKRRPVLMVNDKDRPDAEILVAMANEFMSKEVWR